MTKKITPCLWLDGTAEETAAFYSSVFKNSNVERIAKYTPAIAEASGNKAGEVMTVEFTLADQPFLGLNGGPTFKFTPGVSFFVWCENETEVDLTWKRLSDGGKILMPLDKYPFAEKFGWCDDKFGVGWQVILSPKKHNISPAFLFVQNLFGKGEEAIHFYTSIFPKSKIEALHKEPGSNAVLHGTFLLNGQEFVLMESGMKEHMFSITPAISFIVNCDTQKDIDYYWDKLSAGGTEEPCGWVKDKFGVSWQIVPTALANMTTSSDTKKSENMMKALLKMKKLDLATLEKAFNS